MSDAAQRTRLPWWAWIAVTMGAVVLGPLTPLVVLVWTIIYFGRHPDPATRALFLKRSAFVLVMAAAGFFTLFAAGDALSDPGGWKGLALVASWAVPAALLAVAGWRWSQRALVAFIALTVALVALDVWRAVDPEGWRSFENGHGPASTIATFVVVASMGFLAWQRPKVGGALMLALPIASLTLAAMVHDVGSAPIAAAGVGALPGVLFLLSAYYADRADPPPASTGLGDVDTRSKAA